MKVVRAFPAGLYASHMGMEMCCLFLGLDILRRHGEFSQLVFWLILALYPASLLFNQSAALLPGIAKRNTAGTFVVGIGAMTAVMLLGIRDMATSGSAAIDPGKIFLLGIQLGLCGLGWWLGHSLVRTEIRYYESCKRFQVCILVLLWLTMMGEKAHIAIVVLFFACAALTLTLARWEESLGRSLGVLQGLPLQYVILGCAVVLLPGIFFLFALSPETAWAILNVLKSLGSAVGRLLDFRPLPARGEPVVFEFFRGCSVKPEKVPFSSTPPPHSGSSTQMNAVFLWFVIVALFLLMALLILRAARAIMTKGWHRAPLTQGVEITLVPVSIVSELAFICKRILKRVWQSLVIVLRMGYLKLMRREHAHEQFESIGELYQRLTLLASRQGLRRRPSQTPLEYLESLLLKFPRHEGAMTVITHLFIRARYGRDPLPGEEFQRAKKAWEEIKASSHAP